MTDWVVRRWTRYQQERLYAETPGGTALGFFDVKAGAFHPDDPALLPILRQAISIHLGHVPQTADLSADAAPPGGTGAETPESSAPEPDPAPSQPDWIDISGTSAGAAARARAVAEREAQGRARHFAARLLGVKTDERNWRIGAEGEEAVAAQLAKLGDQWRVLHAVEVGKHGSDIDHVVIGPGGVFTINTKNHPDAKVWVGGDTFLVNGQRVPYVRNSRHEAQRASRLLTDRVGFPVIATGVIAVMGAPNGLVIKAQPGDVAVVKRKRIRQHLEQRPPVLTAEEVDAIYEMARRSTTWR